MNPEEITATWVINVAVFVLLPELLLAKQSKYNF